MSASEIRDKMSPAPDVASLIRATLAKDHWVDDFMLAAWTQKILQFAHSKLPGLWRNRKFWKFDRSTLTATKWLMMRRIRQEACREVLTTNNALLDHNFFDALENKRLEYDKQFWKLAIVQLTITGLLALSLFTIEYINFSIFGVSGRALSKFREFLLFAHALTVGYAIILQQYIHKLEDFLVSYAASKFDKNEEDNDALKIFLFRYIGPIEAFNIGFLPYRKHLFHAPLSKFVFRLHGIFRAISGFGFAAFTMFVPLIGAIIVVLSPNFGWLSYCIVAYWFTVGAFSIASMLINILPLPYHDFTYVMKLQKLQEQNPERHRQIMKESVKTGKWPELP